VSSQLPKVEQDHRHVVAPLAHGARHVRAQTRVEPAVANLLKLDFALHLHANSIHRLLVRVAFPNSVAAHHDEVLLGPQVLHAHVWERGDGLLLGAQPFVFLVSQVSNSAG